VRASSLLTVAGALACAAGGLWGARLAEARLRSVTLARVRAGEGRPYKANSSLLRALSLGHPALVADLTMARAQVYFGAELEVHGPARLLERTLETAVALDPSVRERYLRGAAMLVYSGPMVSADGVQAADRLLQRGARAFPEDWEIWFQLGFNRLYELPALAAGDEAWRRDGQAALARAARLPDAPPWLGALARQAVAREGR
jgi:hypothetical protein